jgi:hypothetical protein
LFVPGREGLAAVGRTRPSTVQGVEETVLNERLRTELSAVVTVARIEPKIGTAAVADPKAKEFLRNADPVMERLIDAHPDFRSQSPRERTDRANVRPEAIPSVEP